jgi:hypothetical protein
MLLCDTLHLVGFQPFDRKRVDDERKKENKSRLLGLGYDPKKPGLRGQEDVSMLSPVKERSATSDPSSPLKPSARDTIFGSSTTVLSSNTSLNQGPTVKVGSTGKEKVFLPSFLDGIANLSPEDYDMLAEYEEEQGRKGHFELIFPTRETIETLGNCFQYQRQANTILWQYIRQHRTAVQSLRQYFASLSQQQM